MTDSAFVNKARGEGALELTADYEDGNNAYLYVRNADKKHAPMIQPINLIDAE